MLSGNFFDIQSFTFDNSDLSQQKINVLAALNSSHQIYHGHFPGNPVVPGVCQVQMVKELLEKAVKHSLKLTESDNIKFLSMISPLAHPLLEFNIIIKATGIEQISVTASIGSGALVFFKFKGKFEQTG